MRNSTPLSIIMTLLAGLSVISACSHVPSLHVEPVERPDYASGLVTSAGEKWRDINQSDEPRLSWVHEVGGQELASLIETSLSSAPNLQAAIARMEAAYYLSDATRARTLPSLNLTGSASHASTATDAFGPKLRTDNSSIGWSLGAFWEVDLWGRLKDGIRATQYDARAIEADLQSLRLSVMSQTALAWVNAKLAIQLSGLADKELEKRQSSYDLTQRRYRNGLSTALDVRLARSAIANVESRIAAAKQNEQEFKRNLEALLFQFPDAELKIIGEMPELLPVAYLPNAVDLLSARPDVRAAEYRLEAAGYRADQARKALRPSLSFSGSAGLSGDEISRLFEPSFLARQIAAQITQPLFDGKARKYDKKAAMARAEAAAYDYASVVLQAYLEVENTRAGDAFLRAQEQALENALKEAQETADLTARQYTQGLVTIFNLVDAQTREIDSERALLSTRAQRVSNYIRYHVALGGPVAFGVSDEHEVESE